MTTGMYIQIIIFLAIQVAAVAYMMGGIKKAINGMSKQIESNTDEIKKVHGRITDHVEIHHTEDK